MNIQEYYKTCLDKPSDIVEHLPTLFEVAKLPEIQKITEFGTRDGESTAAFLAAIDGTDKTIVSYDLYRSDINNEYETIKNYKYFQSDTLQIKIEPTDLLFVDTLHTYFQLYNELGLHSKQVSKCIILHDTHTYGYIDEPFHTYTCGQYPIKMSEKAKITTSKVGLINALNDFLETTKDGANWKIYKQYTNNNGLTILKRKSQ